MPEGDTVKNAATALTAALAGQVVTRSDFRVPLATADLAGYRILECGVRGARPAAALRGAGRRCLDAALASADGRRVADVPGRERPHGRPAHTIRVILTTGTTIAVGFHLHELALIQTADEAARLNHLGPDLLGPDWDARVAVQRLSAEPDREIADALLDQQNLAGIGNLYKSEVLFVRGIWPWRPVREAGDLTALVGLARRMLASMWAARPRPRPDRCAKARRRTSTAAPAARAAAAVPDRSAANRANTSASRSGARAASPHRDGA